MPEFCLHVPIQLSGVVLKHRNKFTFTFLPKVMVFWDVTPCRYPGRWRQQVCPKHWYLCTKLHDVTSQRTIIFIFTTEQPQISHSLLFRNKYTSIFHCHRYSYFVTANRRQLCLSIQNGHFIYRTFINYL
jgi:hypothetical protein